MRVIPAWAGNIWSVGDDFRAFAGHPRVGGEHCGTVALLFLGTGSSPRGRGTFSVQCAHAAQTRVIPAWAGNISSDEFRTRLGTGHPRVGGEHAAGRPLRAWLTGSSPRGRGT